MKAMIYAGIGLFSAATVYGIADYYNTKNAGTLDKIYKEEEPAVVTKKEGLATAAFTAAGNLVIPAIEVIKETGSTIAKKTIKRSKRVSKVFELSDFSRGRIRPPQAEDEEIAEPVVVKEEKQ